MKRFQRQIDLIGKHRQKQLIGSKVLVVGTGGLGSPLLMALAVSGVGTIGVVDDDAIDISNLNRQIIHDEDFLGQKKTKSAFHRLRRMNKDIEIHTYDQRLTEEYAKIIFPDYDIIVDCVDNYETRQHVSSAAMALGKTVIEGGIEGYDGYVQVIVPGKTACFNCLEVAAADIERQVLGASTGVIGNIQALECIKQITGLWNGSYSYISVNTLTYDIDTLLIEKNPNCDCTRGEME